ncbi:MAG: long-chain fatty acid--CoA ligase [Victivallales bacterium]|nr:long-chain fatty acid--CoA ligase [Victivallales bacterium]
MNIYDLIRRETAAFENNTAIVYMNKSWTCAEMWAEVDALALWFRACFGGLGAPVALRCYDSTECVFISLAVLAADGILVPVPPAMSAEETSRLCQDVRAEFLIDQRELYQGARRFTCAGADMYLHALEHDGARREYDEHPAFIRFSSGTTAGSKGVVISHKAVAERTTAANQGLNIGSDDVVLWVLSMAYHFVVTILLFLRRGATIIICQDPAMLTMGQVLKENRVSVLYATPCHYRMMTESDSFDKTMLADVRLAVSTAMSLEPCIAMAFKNKFSVPLQQAYGIIEVGLPCISSCDMDFAPGLVGKPLPGYYIELRDCDAQGRGRIVIQGAGMFCAYLKPFHTFAELCQDGWFDTGDIGYFDDTGNLFVVGREKNVINFAGMKIFPGEVEHVIKSCTGVADVIVYAQASEQYGEIPCADVVPESDAILSSDVLRKHCYAFLSPHQVPKQFYIIECLEKTFSGKNKLKRSGA